MFGEQNLPDCCSSFADSNGTVLESGLDWEAGAGGTDGDEVIHSSPDTEGTSRTTSSPDPQAGTGKTDEYRRGQLNPNTFYWKLDFFPARILKTTSQSLHA